MRKNTTTRAWLLALALVATGSGSLAQSLERFMGAKGFRAVPLEKLEGVGTQWLRFQQVAGMPAEAHTLNQRRQ